jgi:hypothetical protein
VCANLWEREFGSSFLSKAKLLTAEDAENCSEFAEKNT